MSEQVRLCIELFIVYQLKHFIADFPLQINYMIFRKTSPNWDFFLPLFAHASVHAALTLAITMFYAPSLWWLAPLDLVIHFTMDRIKSSPKYLGRFNDLSKPYYWWCLGLDQMVHHITHIYFIYVTVMAAV